VISFIFGGICGYLLASIMSVSAYQKGYEDGKHGRS
jgi:hypothetical protein